MNFCIKAISTNKNARPIKKGDNLTARENESFLESINLMIILNIIKPITRLKSGDITQLKTTPARFPKLITENPPAMIPKPIMAPTIEWVVDTGKDFHVAKLTHRAADNNLIARSYLIHAQVNR